MPISVKNFSNPSNQPYTTSSEQAMALGISSGMDFSMWTSGCLLKNPHHHVFPGRLSLNSSITRPLLSRTCFTPSQISNLDFPKPLLPLSLTHSHMADSSARVNFVLGPGLNIFALLVSQFFLLIILLGIQ